MLLSDLLRQMGASVTQSRSAESARTLLQCGTMADVILVDLQLIGENGQLFARWLRREHRCSVTKCVAVRATRPALNDHEPDPFDQWLPKRLNIEDLPGVILGKAEGK